MKKLTILLFIILSGVNINAQSFHELGKDQVVTTFNEIIIKLGTWKRGGPWEDTKAIRKLIGNTKLLLDTFIHIYPEKGIKNEKDGLIYIHDLLDEGYEVMGHYKDLYDISQSLGEEIDEKEATKRGKKAEKWNEKFLEKVESKNILSYLNDPLKKGFEERKKSDLPKYLWARLEILPKDELDGAQNLNRLSSELLELLADETDSVLKIGKLTKSEKNEEKFHDWRKTLRIVLKINEYFPSEAASSNQEAIELATLAVNKFGDINNLIVAYHNEKDDDDQDEIKDDINELWSQANHWMRENNIKAVLEDLSDFYKFFI